MGFALARAAVAAGHKVTLISAPTSQREPNGVKLVRIETAAQMFEAVKKHFKQCDCLIMAAAVADYTPAQPAKTKMQKINKPLTIKLKPTSDILKWAEKNKSRNQIIVGFALEQKNLRKNAEKKLKEKNLDMIIANTPAAVDAEKSTVQIKTPNDNWITIENSSKITIAKRIIHLAENLFV